jgi:eukaryotic-like serine/threonine-protein kinase
MKTQLGHYDIVSELGRGGMGVVYKGFEGSLHRYVAIKVLADSLAHDEAVKERFLREARSMAALNDPHIIQIYFIGDDDGQTFFVMEFVDGESLGSVLKREGLLHPDQAARIIFQTAQGLATAHDRGVIHRDIKPGNIMITSRGNVKIADFGIALSTSDFSKKLTSTGEFVGTPGYLSPEVCLGRPVDQRSDIFSLGIVLFEMLAGRMPFTDESPLGLMLEVVKAEIPDVCTLNAEVDPELSRILSRMIAKDPNDRYQNCQELINDLSRHPLLAGGGTLRLQTQPSTAAATVIGMKTPLGGQVPLPRTTPTPSSIPRSTPASISTLASASASPPQAQTPVPQSVVAAAHESVLQRQTPTPTKPSSAALPLAIAAIVLLGLGGGAWAFREQIPMLKQWLPDAQIATVPSAPPATPTPAVNTQPAATTVTTAAAPTPVRGNSTATTTDGSGATTAASSAASSAAPASTIPVAAAVPASESASVAELMAANSPAATPPPPATPTAAISPGAESALVDQVAKAYTANGSGPAPRASQVDALKELAAAQAASSAANAQLARSVPPAPVVPPKPHIPTIAVLSGGDISVADPAGRVIEQALSHHGYRLVDAEMMPHAERYLGGQRPNVGGLLDMLAKTGRVDAIVVVHARPTGAQNIAYHGQSDTMNTAQLSVSVYVVQGQQKLGQSWTENVNFTALSAKAQAEEAVEQIAPQVEQVLVDYRPGRNRG